MNINYMLPKALRKIFNKPAIMNSSISSSAKIDCGSVVVDSEINSYSYVGEHSSLIYAEVGKFTSISNYCAIGGGSHPLTWVSMSPVFNSSHGILKKKFADNQFNPFTKTFVGNDVWIGSHCLIKGGVKISDGAVLGMGSVVTKDVGPYEIWAGNPARLIRKRFDDETINQLLQCKWWEWSDDKIEAYAKLFEKPQEFLKELENEY